MDHTSENEEPQMTFELQEGKEIAFVSISGKWHGRIRERLRGCSRAQVLPVFCKGHGDVAAALEALRGKPVKYGQQRIHRMRRRESAGGEEFVYLGELQLKGGGTSSSPQPDDSGVSSSSRRQKAVEEAAMHTNELKRYYRCAKFAWMPSVLPGVKDKHVELLECQLMLLNKNKRKQYNSRNDFSDTCPNQPMESSCFIELGDIFNERIQLVGGKDREIRKVIVVGQAGAGKTTLSHKLAYEWSEGRWCNDLFHIVYVLSVRDLLESKYDSSDPREGMSLATAIASSCYFGDHSDALHEHINLRLSDPKTLVVLDGLDEQHKVRMGMIGEANSRCSNEHKLLVLSRPYGILDETADRVIEHVGFSSKQVEGYLSSELPKEQCKDLMALIRKQPSLEVIARIPLNLEILCLLWKDGDKEGTIGAETGNGSIPVLYRLFIGHAWDKIEDRHEKENIDRDVILDQLGEIALRKLRCDQQLFSIDCVMEILGEDKRGAERMLKFADCLLKSSCKNTYTFPHRTLQEYFAGRRLARMLSSENEEALMEGEKLVCKHKYDMGRGLVLSFMAGEMIAANGKEGLRHAFQLVERKPLEVAGFQHVLLKLRILHEWLCAAKGDLKLELDQLEVEYQLICPMTNYLQECLSQTSLSTLHQPYVVAEMLKMIAESCPSIFNHAPDLLKLICGLILNRNEWSADSQGILHMVVKICPSAALIFVDELINLCKGDDGTEYGVPIGALSWMLHALSAEFVHSSLVMLNLCKDLSRYTQELVPIQLTRYLGQFVAASPVDAPSILENIFNLCRFSIPHVRMSIIQFLGNEGKSCSFKGSNLMLHLLNICKDENEDGLLRAKAADLLQLVLPICQYSIVSVRDCFITVCKDKNKKISECAFSGLRWLAKYAPSEAAGIMGHLIPVCKDENEAEHVRVKAIASLPLILQGCPSEASTVVDCLTMLCKDNNRQIRASIVKTLGLVRILTSCTIASIVKHLINVCQDVNEDEDIRRAAITSLPQVLQGYPSGASSVLDCFATLYKCKHSKILEAALSSLKHLLKHVPSEAESIMEHLINVCKDVREDEHVRVLAIRSLSQILQSCPSESLIVLDCVSILCKEENRQIRGIAVHCFEQLLKYAPSEAAGIMDLLISMCKDENEYDNVRLKAIESLPLVLQDCPSEASVVLDCLTTLHKDKNRQIRARTVRSLGLIMTYTPSTTASIIEHLVKVCEDENEDKHVCIEAAKLFPLVLCGYPSKSLYVLDCLASLCKHKHISISSSVFGSLRLLMWISCSEAARSIEHLIGKCRDEDEGSHLWVELCMSLTVVLRDLEADVSRELQREWAPCNLKDTQAWADWIASIQTLTRSSLSEELNMIDDFMSMCDFRKWDKLGESTRILKVVVQSCLLEKNQLTDTAYTTVGNVCGLIRQKAIEAMKRLTCKQLIDAYWGTKDEALIPLIVEKLHYVSLVLEGSGRHSKLVLYYAGRSAEWSEPRNDMKHFLHLIDQSEITCWRLN